MPMTLVTFQGHQTVSHQTAKRSVRTIAPRTSAPPDICPPDKRPPGHVPPGLVTIPDNRPHPTTVALFPLIFHACPRPLPFPPLSSLSILPSSSSPLPFHPLMGEATAFNRSGRLGERCKLPSGVRPLPTSTLVYSEREKLI